MHIFNRAVTMDDESFWENNFLQMGGGGGG